jgi:hypothetical protein
MMRGLAVRQVVRSTLANRWGMVNEFFGSQPFTPGGFLFAVWVSDCLKEVQLTEGTETLSQKQLRSALRVVESLLLDPDVSAVRIAECGSAFPVSQRWIPD